MLLPKSFTSKGLLTKVIAIFTLVLFSIKILNFPFDPAILSITEPYSRSSTSAPSSFPSPELLVDYFVDYPPRYFEFGQLGRRVQILEEWIKASGPINDGSMFHPLVEKYALSLFPFLRVPNSPEDTLPLISLLQRHKPGSRGIVIPVGKSTFRFACHLIGSIRNVFGSNIPIEIAYAGKTDLPYRHRKFLTSLELDVTLVDVTLAFDESLLDLKNGKWAIKPFAILASRFEQVMLLDSDSILLQAPETIFEAQQGFKETGTLLFHDRLLFKDAYPERHAWWTEEMKHLTPSANHYRSKVHTDNYAEEGESGMVMVDKGRLPVLMGLLHVAWQNSDVVRNRVTYVMGHGDKETWWFAFELCGVPYAFENHYAAVLGEASHEDNSTQVCAFTIAHTDDNDNLLWFNGSLLKNKALNATEYWVPDTWMLDGEWEKGMDSSMPSCKKHGAISHVNNEVYGIISASVDEAHRLDGLIVDVFLQLQ